MIERRHEKLTMDALEDLVGFLRGVREERKAVLAISEGWLLFRPDPRLARPLDDKVPSGPPIGVDPRTGKLGIGTPKGLEAPGDTTNCDTDRIVHSQIDDDLTFRQTQDEGNWSNTSFYPIEPRGLAVFDTEIGLYPPPPLDVVAAMLRTRMTSLRTLADA